MKAPVRTLKKEYGKHKKLREIRHNKWKELAQYFMPEADIVGGIDKDDREEIYDSTAEDANEILAAALHSLLTNPSHKWFSLRFVTETDPSQERKDYLSIIEDKMMHVFTSEETGFSEQVHQMYLKVALFGSAVLYSELKDNQINFKEFPIWDVVCVEDGMGRINRVYREEAHTALQLKELFGNVSDEVEEMLKGSPEKTVKIIHAVVPYRANKKESKGLEKAFRYESVYFEHKTGFELRRGGYKTFPYQIPRWMKQKSVYGYGVGDKTLPDTKTLNSIERDSLIASEKLADPPTYIPDDAMTSEHSSEGGATNYYDPQSLNGGEIFQHPVQADLNAFELKANQKRESIRRMFLNDKLQMVGGPKMTATEVVATQEEKMRILGPVLGRFQSEFLAPLISRVFDLLLTSGQIEQINGEDADIKIEYVSPISQAQKQAESAKFQAAVAHLAPVLQIAPEIRDNFDFDAIARDSQKIFGFPMEYLKSKDDVEEERKARAEQAAKEQQEAEQHSQVELAGKAQAVANG